MRLTKYNQKRNFNKTSEPKGKTKKKKALNLIFVVQKHNARNLHYDLRLEHNSVLISFAVPKKISLDSSIKRLAINVEDHPLEYAKFEGVIPIGEYGAGTVQIWDKGNYYPLKDFNKGLKNGELKFVLNGEKLKGEFHMINTKNNQWLLFKSKDEFSKAEKPKIKNPFTKISVCLAKLTKTIPTGKDWLFETKYDGYRIVAFVENGKVKLKTRSDQDYTNKFKNIEKELKNSFKNKNLVLDGEIVVLDESGKSNFSLLQEAIKQDKDNFIYCIFDILALDGEDLRKEKLIIRKELLRKTLKNSSKSLVFADYVINNGKKLFNLAKKLGLEGIIAKKVNSEYYSGRNGDWLKIKCIKRQEFIVVGYTKTEKNEKLSAILLGYYKDKKLKYAGKVGTGFNNEKRKELDKLFKKNLSKKSYLDEKINIKNAIFLKPNLVAEIEFTELTKDEIIRHGSFIDLREDKNSKLIVLEKEDETN